MRKGTWAPAIWITIACSTLVAGFALVSGASSLLPTVSVIAITLIFAMAAIGGLVEARFMQAAFPAPPREPEVVKGTMAPLSPFSVRAVRDEGTCPLGYRAGDVWAVNGEGQLHRPLCLPAVTAARMLTSTWTEQVAEPTPGKFARCRCPWAQAALTFEAQAAGAR